MSLLDFLHRRHVTSPSKISEYPLCVTFILFLTLFLATRLLTLPFDVSVGLFTVPAADCV